MPANTRTKKAKVAAATSEEEGETHPESASQEEWSEAAQDPPQEGNEEDEESSGAARNVDDTAEEAAGLDVEGEEESGSPEEDPSQSSHPGSDSEAEGSAVSTGGDEGDEPMVLLEEEHCRCSMQSKLGSLRIPLVCGRQASSCNYRGHRQKREAGTRNPPGMYTRFLPSGDRAFQNHGQLGRSFFTVDQWEHRRAANLRAVEEAGEQLRQPPSQRPGSADTRVTFGRDSARPGRSGAPSIVPQGSSRSPAAYVKERNTPPPALHRPPFGGRTWIGLQNAQGARVICNEDVLVLAMEAKGYSYQRMFSDYNLAQVWKDEEQHTVDEEEGEEPPPSPPRRPKKGAPKKPPNSHLVVLSGLAFLVGGIFRFRDQHNAALCKSSGHCVLGGTVIFGHDHSLALSIPSSIPTWWC